MIHTFSREVHASKLQGANNLSFHVLLEVDKDCGEVSVRVVGYAGGGHTLEKLCSGKFGGQHSQVLVDERTQWYTVLGQELVIFVSRKEVWPHYIIDTPTTCSTH